MQQAVVEGLVFAYETMGSGEPVVTIHGAFIADTFRPLLSEPSLTGRHRIINYRRRGYSDSSTASPGFSLADQASDCRTLLHHLGIERAHVVGHSFGGSVALQLALDHPALVHSLTLLEPAIVSGPSLQDYRDELALAVRRYKAGQAVAEIVDQFFRVRYSADYRKELERILPGSFEQAVSDAAASFEVELPSLDRWPFSEATAKKISQPALIVLGGKSDQFSPRFRETQRLLLDWLPEAEGVIIPGSAHMLSLQQPTSLAKTLARFLAAHPMD